MSVKNIQVRHNIDLTQYINTETGEFLNEELPSGTTVTISSKNEDIVNVNYDEYLMVDLEALRYLREHKIITQADKGKILDMAETLKTEYNAMYKHTIPHTLESISELIGNTYDYTTKFIKKLCKKNIVHRYVTADKVLYCLNPFLTRRRKTISKELLSVFGKFKK